MSGIPFQSRVGGWMLECFDAEIAADKVERADRFIEEAIELVQAQGHSKTRVMALVDYVYGRDVGDPPQEVGGVMVTLAALCLADDMDMAACAEAELARINDPDVIIKIREKQASKPTGSALPQAESYGGYINCWHCGWVTAARMDPCSRCGVWQSKKPHAGRKR